MSIWKSKRCFRIVRSSAFQNTSYFLSGMHFRGLKTPKTKWEKIRETPCICNEKGNMERISFSCKGNAFCFWKSDSKWGLFITTYWRVCVYAGCSNIRSGAGCSSAYTSEPAPLQSQLWSVVGKCSDVPLSFLSAEQLIQEYIFCKMLSFCGPHA